MNNLQVTCKRFNLSACFSCYIYAQAILTGIYRVDGVVIGADAMVRAPGLVDAS